MNCTCILVVVQKKTDQQKSTRCIPCTVIGANFLDQYGRTTPPSRWSSTRNKCTRDTSTRPHVHHFHYAVVPELGTTITNGVDTHYAVANDAGIVKPYSLKFLTFVWHKRAQLNQDWSRAATDRFCPNEINIKFYQAWFQVNIYYVDSTVGWLQWHRDSQDG